MAFCRPAAFTVLPKTKRVNTMVKGSSFAMVLRIPKQQITDVWLTCSRSNLRVDPLGWINYLRLRRWQIYLRDVYLSELRGGNVNVLPGNAILSSPPQGVCIIIQTFDITLSGEVFD